MGARGVLARDLPWIGHHDPWAVLVAEVMLQQTSVARVREPWAAFLAAYPTPRDLAEAPLDEVLTRWRGLGYPRRAKNLRLAAAALVRDHAGSVPSDPESLRALPGVGEYTAAAVASFAFGAPISVLDTNVGRVLARAVAGEPLTRRAARELADAVRGRRSSSRVNQALIDLGAQFCRSRPLCEQCPMSRVCRWRRLGGPDPAPSSAGVSRPQAPYRGSLRELRGRILAALGEGERVDLRVRLDDVAPQRLEEAIASLVRDGLVEAGGGRLARA